MLDYGHQWTDAELKRLERRIKKEYDEAYKQAKRNLREYTAKFKEQDKINRAKVKAGEMTKTEYNDWKQRKVFVGKQYEQMRDVLATDITKVDLKVASITNGFLPEAYAENFNFATYQIESTLNINTAFTLYDKGTVERLLREQPKVLPMNVNIPASERWNQKKIQSQITQSVLLGESIDQTANRLRSVTDMSANAAIRNARTAMTGAQNAGRVDSYERAKILGIKLKQEWMATIDGRTRDSHRLMDGEIVEVGAQFSNGCAYPGDPGGPPSEIYNCRCTLVAALDDMDNDMSDLSERFVRDNGYSDYFDWKAEHLDDEGKAKAKLNYWKNQQDAITIKTYSGILRQDVQTSEYAQYKDRIQGKRDYYNQQLSVLTPSDPDYQKFSQYLKDLDEFERNGKRYMLYGEEKLKAEQSLRAARAANVDPKDMFSQARKDAALWFDKSTGGFRAADAYFDPPAKAVHSAATREEHHGFYTYTSASGGHNRPLAGYQKPYSQPGSGWEEKFYVGPEKVWIDFEGKGDDIRNLTTLIEKSSYPEDIWLQSGQGFETLEGTLGLPRGSLMRKSDAELQFLVDTEFELGQFISTAVNEGGGSIFNAKPTKWNIYAPSGSEMLYASDVGAFGKGENELILQRGGHYKITKIYWGNDATDGNDRKLFIDIELHPEKGYNKFQQDPSEWKGSKKNYRD